MVSYYHADGVISEDALISLVYPLLRLTPPAASSPSSCSPLTIGYLREKELLHPVFGCVFELLSERWPHEGYLERFRLSALNLDDFSRYGAREQSSECWHYRLGVRARTEWPADVRYRFCMESLMSVEASEAVIDQLRKKEQKAGIAGGGGAAAAAAEEEQKEQKERKADDEDGDDGFSFTQPAGSASSRRSSTPVTLPQSQQAQLLSPQHQAMARFLLSNPCVSEAQLSAHYRAVTKSRNPPSLSSLAVALNAALNWAALHVVSTVSEYDGSKLWLLVNRSQQDAHAVFAAYREEEVTVLRAWVWSLRQREQRTGTASLSQLQLETVARSSLQSAGVTGERRRRLLDSVHRLADSLVRDGWLQRLEGQQVALGMRTIVELLQPAVGAAAGAAGAAGPELCAHCRSAVWFGQWCGLWQEEDVGCREKFHVSCVRDRRRVKGGMRCTQGHLWREKRRREQAEDDDDGDGEEREAEEGDEGKDGDDDGMQEEREEGQQEEKRRAEGEQEAGPALGKRRRGAKGEPELDSAADDEEQAEDEQRQSRSGSASRPRRRLRRGG